MSGLNISFSYTTLDTSKHEIRLVIIEPASSQDERLICRLTTTRLSDSPHDSQLAFDALSYTWGTDNAEIPVEIDEGTFLVRQNLDRALRVLRKPLHATRVWIDAICINQNDIDERDEHVRYMHRVYHEASQVLIWLGDAGGDSDWLITQAQKIDEEVHAKMGASEEDQREMFINRSNTGLWRLIHDLDRLGAAITELAKRPWWQRVWTLQEFICASKDPVFLCGSLRFSPHILRRIIYAIGGQKLMQSESEPSMPSKTDLAFIFNRLDFNRLDLNYLTRSRKLRKVYFDAESGSKDTYERLVQALVKVRRRQATDPRDRVFALLNLIPPAEWPPGQPNYRKSTAVVYAETVRFIIEKSKRLTLLALCEPSIRLDADTAPPDDEPVAGVPGLPSWVPDWTRRRISNPLLREYEDREEAEEGFSEFLEPFACPFKAGGDLDAFVRFSEDSMHLTVKGVVTDRIVAQVTTIPGVVQEELFQIPQVYEQLTNLLVHQGVDKPVLFGCSSYLELLWWTMTGKLSPLDGEATLEHFAEFEDWVGSGGKEGNADEVTYSIRKNSCGRRFFVTSKGFFGSGPEETAMGDYICVLLGSAVPIIIRQASRAADIWKAQKDEKDGINSQELPLSEWRSAPDADTMNLVIGESYVHGIMDGSVIQSVQEVRADLEEITLS